MSLQDGFNLDSLLDALAAKVVERLERRPSDTTSLRPRLLTVEEAATYLGRSKTGIQHLVAEGTLPVVRADRRVFIDREDLDRWIEAKKV